MTTHLNLHFIHDNTYSINILIFNGQYWGLSKFDYHIAQALIAYIILQILRFENEYHKLIKTHSC